MYTTKTKMDDKTTKEKLKHDLFHAAIYKDTKEARDAALALQTYVVSPENKKLLALLDTDLTHDIRFLNDSDIKRTRSGDVSLTRCTPITKQYILAKLRNDYVEDIKNEFNKTKSFDHVMSHPPDKLGYDKSIHNDKDGLYAIWYGMGLEKILVGYTIIYPDLDPAYLSVFEIFRQWRGKNIGKKAISHMCDLCKKEGIKLLQVFPLAEPEGFYKKCGFYKNDKLYGTDYLYKRT